MRTPVVAGNWKMNGTRASVQSLVDAIRAGVGANNRSDVIVCPPFPYLQSVSDALRNSRVALGAQNLSEYAVGAYTGEVSGAMLLEFGVSHVIVGHSERRALLAESNAQVADKFAAALAGGLCPILCVGETLAEREQERTLQVVEAQLMAVVERAGIDAFKNAIVAYEPVWAIGTGLTATPEQAQDVHQALRDMVSDKSATIAAELRILYGGSVKASNANSLFECPDIDGGLIGGASLDATEFLAICQAAG